MEIVATKVIVAILFGAIRFFFGILPIKLYHCLRRWEHEDNSASFINQKRHQQLTCMIALCQSFGGGVLFATCMLHMMPEVYRSVEELKKFGDFSTNYPLSQLTICMGFFLVYFIEEASHWLITKVPEEPCTKTSDTKRTNEKKNKISITPCSSSKVNPEKNEKNGDVFIIDNEVKDFNDDEKKQLEGAEPEDFETLSISSEVKRENEKNAALDEETDEVEELEKEIESNGKTRQQIFRGVLVILALSLHSIFEGLAIGLQHSAGNIWYLFIAVSIHSATILFCMGLELLIAKTKMQIIFVHIFILSITSPLGILIGLVITLSTDMNTKAKSTAIVLLEGISAGTILYITFFEVLNREKHRRVYRLRRGLCILGGFFLMAILQLVEV